ncbi:hypothetical protein [Thiocapsa sp. UBA6158]|jgi:hypothetical protein|uniref:hypothetical protein n=1 Tax=Thiocapsa sp. UBA6158 TaxID=1947692 RepID=UPI0025DAD9A9|nr:hypothetical protein [Thiocapsa sp. UBA6158]
MIDLSEHRHLSETIATLTAEFDGPDRDRLKAAQHRQALATDALTTARRITRDRPDDARLIEAQQHLDDARTAVARVQAEIATKHEKIGELSRRRAELTGGARGDVGRAVAAVETARAAVARVTAALTDLPDVPQDAAPIDHDSLAGVVLGEADAAAVAREYAQRAKNQAARAADAERLALTRTALEARLQAAQTALSDAEHDAHATLHAALRGELETQARAFAAAAGALFTEHGRLIETAEAVRELDRRLGSNSAGGLGLDSLKPLNIPALSIPGLAKLPSDTREWRAERAAAGRALVREALTPAPTLPPALEQAA